MPILSVRCNVSTHHPTSFENAAQQAVAADDRVSRCQSPHHYARCATSVADLNCKCSVD
jgi:hypothetical protein